MKKTLSLLLLVALLVSTSTALANANINRMRQEAKERIEQTPTVTYNEVLDNPNAYIGSAVNFRAKLVILNFDNMTAMFIEDGDETKPFFVGILPYRFKMGEYYTVVGTVKDIFTPKGDNRPKWILIQEEHHLPYLSEYGL